MKKIAAKAHLILVTALVLALAAGAHLVQADALVDAYKKQVVIPESQIASLGNINVFDSSFGIINRGNGQYDYIGSIHSHSTGVTAKKYSGTASSISSQSNIALNGIPSPYVGWILNTYVNPNTGNILGIIHLENGCCNVNTRYRLGLAYSKDGGNTFNYLGTVVSPRITDQEVLQITGNKGTNIGGGGYIIRDGELWLYYGDTDSPFDPNNNTKLAVAKASLSSVLSAGENGGALPGFSKYYNGAWNEPGIGGRFTPLESGAFGAHADIAYNSYLNQYVYVNWNPNGLSMKVSADPLNWNVPLHMIHTNTATFDFYPTIVGKGSDTRITGSSFYVYFATNNLHEYSRIEITVMPTNTATTAPVGQEIWIKAQANNKFVGANLELTDRPLTAWASNVGAWEKFKVIDAGGGAVALLHVASNKYVGANIEASGAPLTAWASAIGEWEKFRWVDWGNNNFGLKTYANNSYVSADITSNANSLKAWTSNVDTWETFTWGL